MQNKRLKPRITSVAVPDGVCVYAEGFSRLSSKYEIKRYSGYPEYLHNSKKHNIILNGYALFLPAN